MVRIASVQSLPHLAVNEVLRLAQKSLRGTSGDSAVLHVGPEEVLGAADARVATPRLPGERCRLDGEERVGEGDDVLELWGDCQRPRGQVGLLQDRSLFYIWVHVM